MLPEEHQAFFFFLLDTVSMGTHSLSGTRDYSNVLCRRGYMYQKNVVQVQDDCKILCQPIAPLPP